MAQAPIFKSFKETSLPVQLQAHSIYYIAPPDKPDYVEIYVTDASGRAKRLFGENDVKTLLNEFKAAHHKADLWKSEDPLNYDFSQGWQPNYGG